MEKKLGMVRTEGHREHGWLSQMQCTTSMLVMKHERSIQKYQKIRVIFFEQFIWMFVCCSECSVAGWLAAWLVELRLWCNERVCLCFGGAASKSENKRAFTPFYYSKWLGDVSLSAVLTSPTVTNLCISSTTQNIPRDYIYIVVQAHIRSLTRYAAQIFLECQNGSFLRAAAEPRRLAMRNNVLLLLAVSKHELLAIKWHFLLVCSLFLFV